MAFTLRIYLKYESSVDETVISSKNKKPEGTMVGRETRVQDAELQKMSDPGKCLSLHQPYASLLVAGIKK